MNNLLLFFAFPIATIILSITAQKLIKSPILVSSVFFAIYLIVAFAVFNVFFIMYAIIYSVFAYITALMTQMVFDYLKEKKEKAVANAEAINNTIQVKCTCRQNGIYNGRCRRYR